MHLSFLSASVASNVNVLRIFVSISSSACLLGAKLPGQGQASWFLSHSSPHFFQFVEVGNGHVLHDRLHLCSHGVDTPTMIVPSICCWLGMSMWPQSLFSSSRLPWSLFEGFFNVLVSFVGNFTARTSYSACNNPSLIHHHWEEHVAAVFLLSAASLPRRPADGCVAVFHFHPSYFCSAVISHMIKLNEKLDDLTLGPLNIGSFVTSLLHLPHD